MSMVEIEFVQHAACNQRECERSVVDSNWWTSPRVPIRAHHSYQEEQYLNSFVAL
jgi:hypothetical protein